MVVQLARDPLPFTLLRGNDAVEQFAPLIECLAQVLGELAMPVFRIAPRLHHLRQFQGASAEILGGGAQCLADQIRFADAGVRECRAPSAPQRFGHHAKMGEGTCNAPPDDTGEGESKDKRSSPGYDKDQQCASNRGGKNLAGYVDGHSPPGEVNRAGGLIPRTGTARLGYHQITVCYRLITSRGTDTATRGFSHAGNQVSLAVDD